MQKKRDSALKCIQKKKLRQYLKDNNINTAIEDLTDEQLAELNSSQNKKGPRYDMNSVKVVMPMETEECWFNSRNKIRSVFLHCSYMSKQEIINDVYYDRAGYESRQKTLKEAREKDKSITIDDVNEFFKKNVEAKRNLWDRTVLQHHIRHTSTKKLFLDDLEDQKFKVGMIMIDVFDKFMHVVAIKGKKGLSKWNDWVSA